jgi:4-amino-4-deoxy-L-arabinose transferase-like glycosyltransferase
VALLLIGAYCRLANLADNPAWDGDEGYNWSIAAHLAHGQVQMFALRYAFVQHPPLFYLLGAALMRLWGEDLLVLRGLSVACGMLTAAGLFGLGSRLGGRRLGCAAPAIYLIWPQTVLQIRRANNYNLLALLVVLALWAALSAAGDARPRGSADQGAADEHDTPYPIVDLPSDRSRWPTLPMAALAGLLTGLALATDQEALLLLLALALLLQPLGLRPLLVWLAMAALPPLLYLGWMLAIRPDDLRFDILHTASRLDGGPLTILARLVHLVQFDPLIGLGLLGLLLLRRGRARTALLWLAALLTLLILKVRDPNPLFRAAEPLLPLAALGLGALLLAIQDLIGRYISARRRPFTAALLTLGLGLPLLAADLHGAHAGFATGLAPTLPRSTVEARRMATWINAHSRPSDLVIVMPATAWLFHSRTADLLQAVAIDGHTAGFYPAGLDRARFRYDTRLAAARYLVVDAFTRLWIADSGATGEHGLVAAARRSWPLVYARGEYRVYANPDRTDAR